MAKVIFRVHGWGELNGRFKIDIEEEMDSHLAQRIKSKKYLIKYVEQKYPGIEIRPNSLGYRINYVKKPTAKNEIETNIKKSKKKTKTFSENKNKAKSKSSKGFLIFKLIRGVFKIIWSILKWISKD